MLCYNFVRRLFALQCRIRPWHGGWGGLLLLLRGRLLDPLLHDSKNAEANLRVPGSCNLQCEKFRVINALSEELHNSCPVSMNVISLCGGLWGCHKPMLGIAYFCNDEDSVDSFLNRFPVKDHKPVFLIIKLSSTSSLCKACFAERFSFFSRFNIVLKPLTQHIAFWYGLLLCQFSVFIEISYSGAVVLPFWDAYHCANLVLSLTVSGLF